MTQAEFLGLDPWCEGLSELQRDGSQEQGPWVRIPGVCTFLTLRPPQLSHLHSRNGPGCSLSIFSALSSDDFPWALGIAQDM